MELIDWVEWLLPLLILLGFVVHIYYNSKKCECGGRMYENGIEWVCPDCHKRTQIE